VRFGDIANYLPGLSLTGPGRPVSAARRIVGDALISRVSSLEGY
jgi:hypothetical protein